AELWAGEVTSGLLVRGAEIEEREGLVLNWEVSPRAMLGRLQLRTGQLDEARAMLEELQVEATSRGDEFSLRFFRGWLGVVEWMTGRWPRALEHTTAVREANQDRTRATRFAAARILGLLGVDLGLVGLVRATAEEGSRTPATWITPGSASPASAR